MPRVKSERPNEPSDKGSALDGGSAAKQKPAVPLWMRLVLRVIAISAICLAAWLLIWGPTKSQCETVDKRVVSAGTSTSEVT